MLSTTKCPICNNQAEHEYYIESVGTVEEHIRCNHCGYCYEFTYGAYREYIGDKEFVWSYTIYNDNCACRRLMKKISRTEFMARRNWKKGIRKYNRGDCSD